MVRTRNTEADLLPEHSLFLQIPVYIHFHMCKQYWTKIVTATKHYNVLTIPNTTQSQNQE